MTWSRPFVACLVLACSTSCIIDIGPDESGQDELGDANVDSDSSSEAGTAGSEAGTTSSSEADTTSSAEADTVDTTGSEADTTDGTTGEPCMPAEVTEVEACPEIIGEGFCSEGGGHVDTQTVIEWGNNPPHSGKHFPIWETAGEHLTPVERGYWVHNLEHGWIVLAYNCPQPCKDELDVLREVIAARPDLSILMTEDPLLDGPRFAAISWTWVHEFEVPVLDELLCFVDQHFDHAPESVP